MNSAIAMGSSLVASAARFGWFYGVNMLLDREAQRLGQRPSYKPKRPVPTRAELMRMLAELMIADAEAVRRGEAPPVEPDPDGAPEVIARISEMFADLPSALSRREAEDAASVRLEPGAAQLPDYYVQDFHFQSGGYLSDRSARLYDVQVETLFYGAANVMRRAALPPISREIVGRDQRRLALLDVACGTGRFLRQARLMWPAMQLTGLDLSTAYLSEARRHLGRLRPAALLEANAEAMPLPDASQDIVTCVFMFHELPPEVRRRVAREISRVLKPGGLLVLVDSLQMGDRPGWDGLLEAFPVRFHEPYFRGYAIDDLDGLLAEAGLAPESRSLAFLSKVLVRRKLA
jgi:ubiquinone/menaquinone biosynthesis C-methylase UbiE